MATKIELTIAAGPTVSLASCPVGLFVSESGALCLKTEYREKNGAISAFLVSTGEAFWGGTSDPDKQQQLQVRYVIAPDAV
jgi:hypothetical protein